MPRVDFPAVEEAKDFGPIPDGRYLCRLAGVATADKDGHTLRTRGGDEMWDLRFQVEEGEHAGSNIYDRISFGKKALSRVKLLCSRLGVDTSQELDVTPDLIRGRSCWVTVETETYTNSKGDQRQRNTVPFAGFEAIEEPVSANGAKPDPDDDLPF